MIETNGILLLMHLAISKTEIGTREIMDYFRANKREIGYSNLMRLVSLFEKNGWVAKRVEKGIPSILKVKITDSGLQYTMDLYGELDGLLKSFGTWLHAHNAHNARNEPKSRSIKPEQENAGDLVDSIAEILITDVLGLDLEDVDSMRREKLNKVAEKVIRLVCQTL